MKRSFVFIFMFIFAALGLTGCSPVGDKSLSLSFIYFVASALSLILLIICSRVVKKKRTWFVMLFSSVLVVNVGYSLLSVSSDINTALWANRLSYLGSVLLPFSMLMIILNLTNTKYGKWLPITLGGVALVVFLIAASPGILDIYYKEVHFAVINGTAVLSKVYGPLHPIYLIYLVGYFSAMVTIIVRATVKKAIDSTSHAIVAAIAVFVNIGVWLIEQLSDIDFEFLSVSYIISELFLLGVHLVMNENQRLKELVRQKEEALSASKAGNHRSTDATPEMIRYFESSVCTLTPTEKIIFDAYVSGASTKEIMTKLEIKENTLKFHNKNIYGKLGVSSRKQLVEIHRIIEEDLK